MVEHRNNIGAPYEGTYCTDIGQVSVDTDVIAKYAGMAAVECFGVVGMAMISVKDGLVKLLKRESMTKGVGIFDRRDNQITIDFHIIYQYTGIII